ncbi:MULTISPECIES: GH32 C-terminal domain-containing protein [unclassified Streptomyces]|uniref:GH32 C-terminal domain-containing protein n=1 Tax=unclassified Streptomyces TaxID=2593676 RepID=UPI003FA3B9A6
MRRTSTPLSLDTAEGERCAWLFMDSSSVEVFGSDGRATISSPLSRAAELVHRTPQGIAGVRTWSLGA